MGTYLVVQRLGLHASTLRGVGLIPSWRSKIPHATVCTAPQKKSKWHKNEQADRAHFHPHPHPIIWGVPAPTGALHYPLDVHLASLSLTDIWGVANSALQTLLKWMLVGKCHLLQHGPLLWDCHCAKDFRFTLISLHPHNNANRWTCVVKEKKKAQKEDVPHGWGRWDVGTSWLQGPCP